VRLDTDHEWAECDRRAESSRAVARVTLGGERRLVGAGRRRTVRQTDCVQSYWESGDCLVTPPNTTTATMASAPTTANVVIDIRRSSRSIKHWREWLLSGAAASTMGFPAPPRSSSAWPREGSGAAALPHPVTFCGDETETGASKPATPTATATAPTNTPRS